MKLKMIKLDTVFIKYGEDSNNVIGFEVEGNIKKKNNNNPYDFLYPCKEHIFLSKTPIIIEGKEDKNFHLALFMNSFKVVFTTNNVDYFLSTKKEFDFVLEQLKLTDRELRKEKIKYIQDTDADFSKNSNIIEIGDF